MTGGSGGAGGHFNLFDGKGENKKQQKKDYTDGDVEASRQSKLRNYI